MLYNIHFAYQYEINIIYILPIKINFAQCPYACKNTGNEKISPLYTCVYIIYRAAAQLYTICGTLLSE